eukprot:GHRQ01015142.1.p1 GENE.GHRQ01015142.1~~GHRQ01015142.1.p1  ORF type:complete len:135 (+),score=29.30 GHRQ01015142.1:1578-1982(+)
MARAVAAGGDEAAGLAVATAVVYCEGGASAEAFSQALSQAIEQDPYTGCLVVTEAKAYAYARCGPTGAFATSGSATTERVLGICQLPLTTAAGPNIPSSYYSRRPSGWWNGGWWSTPSWWSQGDNQYNQYNGRK